jgi:hypothetical protein
LACAPFRRARSTYDTAKAYQGLFRQIEKQSFAQLAYIKALSDALLRALAILAVAADYIRDDSFLQDLMIKRVETPVSALSPTRS